jgi:hypothetical protein
MDSTSLAGLAPLRLLVGGAIAGSLLFPAWWMAGRVSSRTRDPGLRMLVAIGLALVGYLTIVNLVGRLVGDSRVAVAACALVSAAASAWLWRRNAARPDPSPLRPSPLGWVFPLILALTLGLPQWLLTVSTNYWDEVPSSAIQLTAANQFAEGVFPPRHNALPEVVAKYHYGFPILSGTVEMLLSASANTSVDVTSTALWVFAFLFVFFWMRDLGFDRLVGAWGGFAVLLSGGLGWLYLPRLEAYRTGGYEKTPGLAQLLHRFDASRSWLDNLVATAVAPSVHLRNADGSLSDLPWGITAQFQQHAVALGLALSLVALYLFTVWQARREFHRPLLAANVATFGLLFLGHAVFGGAMAVAAGLYLLGAWLRERNRTRFLQGLFFSGGVGALAFLHGGMLVSGAEYGGGDFATVRDRFGYAAGGSLDFLHWNLAGFGVPLLLSLAAWGLHRSHRDEGGSERSVLFALISVFTIFCYLVPHLVFYSSETIGVEEFTEISKFFFCAHLGFGLLSVFGLAYLPLRVRRAVLVPALVAAAIFPVAFCYANAFDADGSWRGFYRSPYFADSVEERMGTALRSLKHGPRDVYFDASADERKHGFLSELLLYGGSVFTLTPSRFERTGIGFRLSQSVVAQRMVQNGRMARLLPGAAEESSTRWYYTRPVEDMALAPVAVRSRFAKLVAEKRFVLRASSEPRALYAIEGETADLDRGLHLSWSPRIVSQASRARDGSEESGLVFYDFAAGRILVGNRSFSLPEQERPEFVHVHVGRFPGDGGLDFLIARMADTHFRLGKRIDDIVERNDWAWSYRDSRDRRWQAEYRRWLWDADIALVADLDDDGFDSHLAFRPKTGEWTLAPGRRLEGPRADAKDLPLPFAGRFLGGSRGDLGLWSQRTGMVTLRSVEGTQSASFSWGGAAGDVLVPGDYDGDGDDEIAVWQRQSRTWYWRGAEDATISSAKFGTETCLPVPWDYDGNGTLDLAYWEAAEGRIHVSFDRGASVGRVIAVPPGSIPAFVNWE